MYPLLLLFDTLSLLLYFVLAPLLIIQASLTRQKVLFLPEPPGERQGEQGSGEPLRILILGDSAGAGVGAPTQELGLVGRLKACLQDRFRLRWALWAQTGFSTQDTLELLAQQDAEDFDVAVVSLGVNDVTALTPLHRWLSQQRELVMVLQRKFGVRTVVLSGLPPMHAFPLLPEPLRFCLGLRARLFTLTLSQLLEDQPKVFLVKLDQPFTSDMMSMDGFHPGPPIYAIWAQKIAARL